jgi:hypothetical protein
MDSGRIRAMFPAGRCGCAAKGRGALKNGDRRSILPNGLWLQEPSVKAFRGDKAAAFVLRLFCSSLIFFAHRVKL